MNDKLIMAIETSNRACSVAVSSGSRIICEIYSDTDMTMHSRTIMPMVDDALARAGLCLPDIDVFAANVGPGSFTGVRIGICTVKGLAKALNKPVFCADAHDVLAVSVYAKNVCAMIDAGRGQAYYAIYEDGRKTAGDSVAFIDDILANVKTPAVFVGDGAEVYKDQITAANGTVAALSQPRARDICLLAALSGRFVEPEEMTANYIRESGAVRKKHGEVYGKGCNKTC